MLDLKTASSGRFCLISARFGGKLWGSDLSKNTKKWNLGTLRILFWHEKKLTFFLTFSICRPNPAWRPKSSSSREISKISIRAQISIWATWASFCRILPILEQIWCPKCSKSWFFKNFRKLPFSASSYFRMGKIRQKLAHVAHFEFWSLIRDFREINYSRSGHAENSTTHEKCEKNRKFLISARQLPMGSLYSSLYLHSSCATPMSLSANIRPENAPKLPLSSVLKSSSLLMLEAESKILLPIEFVLLLFLPFRKLVCPLFWKTVCSIFVSEVYSWG